MFLCDYLMIERKVCDVHFTGAFESCRRRPENCPIKIHHRIDGHKSGSIVVGADKFINNKYTITNIVTKNIKKEVKHSLI